jgi:predicted enzyme involved in methoxymalonyl-ACP biosynthesis
MSMVNTRVRIQNITTRLHSKNHIKIGAAIALRCTYPPNELFDISTSAEKVTLFDLTNIYSCIGATYVAQEDIDRLGDIVYNISATVKHHEYGTMRLYDINIIEHINTVQDSVDIIT